MDIADSKVMNVATCHNCRAGTCIATLKDTILTNVCQEKTIEGTGFT